MLFLLNSQVLDIHAEIEAMSIEAAEERRSTPSLFSAVQLAQRVLFAAGSFEKADQVVVRRIAATIALSSEANVALFVVALNARSWNDVATRLASAPLTTMAYLLRLQKQGQLSAGVINRDVWGQVMIEVDPAAQKITA